MKKKRGQNKSFSLNDSFKKNHRGLKINIKLSNRWLYFFITLGMIAIVGVGVYAAIYTNSGAGHPITEISTCSTNGQILKMSGEVWTCGSDNVGFTSCTTRSQSLSSRYGSIECPSSYTMTGGGCQSGYYRGVVYSIPSTNGWRCDAGSDNYLSAIYVRCCR